MHTLEIKLKNCAEIISIPIKNPFAVINGKDTYSKEFSQLLSDIKSALDSDGFLEMKTGDNLHYILINANELAMIHIVSNHN